MSFILFFTSHLRNLTEKPKNSEELPNAQEILYTIRVAKAKTISVNEPPKIPMNFGGHQSSFGGGPNIGGGRKSAFAPKIRITQSKGAGSGK